MNFRVGALVLGAIGLVVGVLVLGHFPPGAVLLEMFRGAFGDATRFSGTLKEMTPLLIAGIAVFIALRAGLFNIGVEGQFTIGALVCAVIALRVPGVAGMALGAIGGSLAGALWAYPAALIKAYRNGHEVITTIMLNNIAGFLTTALVAGPLKDPLQQDPSTADVRTMLPSVISHPEVNLALVLGLGLVGVVWVWLRRRVSGFELEAVGVNPKAAALAGIATKAVTVRAMLLSGAVGGLAGSFQVLAFAGRFYKDFGQGYGFDSLGVALLAGSNPLALIPASLMFGAVKKGASSISVSHGVPKGISLFILGLTIVVFAAIRYRKQAERTDV